MLINEGRPSLASLARTIWCAFLTSGWFRSADKVSRNTQWILSLLSMYMYAYIRVTSILSFLILAVKIEWTKLWLFLKSSFEKITTFLQIKIALCFRKSDCNFSYYRRGGRSYLINFIAMPILLPSVRQDCEKIEKNEQMRLLAGDILCTRVYITCKWSDFS